MVSASHEGPTRSAISSALTHGFLLRRKLFVVREAFLAPKISFTFGAGNSDIVEGARGTRHTITTCLFTHVRNVSHSPFVAYFKYVLLRHRARYIHDHVIVLIDIIVE